MIKIKNGALYQWDLNRSVEIDDPENRIYEIECCKEGDDAAVILPFSRTETKVEAFIPNAFLQSFENISIFVVFKEDAEERTIDFNSFSVIPRTMPSDYVYEETEILQYKELATEFSQALSAKADLDENGKLKAEQLPETTLSDEALTEAVNTALTQAKESGEFKGADGYTPVKGVDYFDGTDGQDGVDGKDGYTPVKGVDYFTEEEKSAIISELSQIEAPKIVSSTDEMTDTSKHYVFDGYIYYNKEVVTEGETVRTYPNQFVPSTASLNTRLSGSAGTTSTGTSAVGYFTSDFIPVTDMETITPYYMRLKWEMPSTSDNKVVFYDANKTRIGANFISYNTNTTNQNGETVMDLKTIHTSSSAAPSSWADVAYIKVQASVNSSLASLTSADIENLEITFDAVYTETTTESTTKNEWVNSGISYTPTFRTDLIGVMGEGNVIYLSDNLPSGTYTLKYGDEAYETVGTITVE